MKKLYAIVLLAIFPYNINAQNLTPNFGFEEYQDCPPGLAYLTCSSWYQLTQGNPDYFNECSTNFTNTLPKNSFGDLKAFDKACIGLLTYHSTFQSKEYIAAFLNGTMQPGVPYEVSMMVSHADSSGLATDDLGMYFGDTAGLNLNTTGVLAVVPDVMFTQGTPFTNKGKWTKLSAIFTPKQKCNHIIIGGFSDYGVMQTKATPPGRNECYYFIDNVEVIKAPLAVATVNANAQPIIFPMPNNGRFTLSAPIQNSKYTLCVSNQLGQEIYRQTGYADADRFSKIIDISNAPAGSYFLTVNSDNFVKTIRFMVN